MPVEIKELNIKISLDNSDTTGAASAQADASNGNAMQQGTLVDIVVEKVLEILKTKSER